MTLEKLEREIRQVEIQIVQLRHLNQYYVRSDDRNSPRLKALMKRHKDLLIELAEKLYKDEERKNCEQSKRAWDSRYFLPALEAYRKSFLKGSSSGKALFSLNYVFRTEGIFRKHEPSDDQSDEVLEEGQLNPKKKELLREAFFNHPAIKDEKSAQRFIAGVLNGDSIEKVFPDLKRDALSDLLDRLCDIYETVFETVTLRVQIDGMVARILAGQKLGRPSLIKAATLAAKVYASLIPIVGTSQSSEQSLRWLIDEVMWPSRKSKPRTVEELADASGQDPELLRPLLRLLYPYYKIVENDRKRQAERKRDAEREKWGETRPPYESGDPVNDQDEYLDDYPDDEDLNQDGDERWSDDDDE